MATYTIRVCPDCNGSGKGEPVMLRPPQGGECRPISFPCELCMGSGKVGLVPWPSFMSGCQSTTFKEQQPTEAER